MMFVDLVAGAQVDSDDGVLDVSNDITVDKEITARKGIHWKYVVLPILILGAFFLMIKLVSEPIEPVIIMDEPALVQLATAPSDSENTEAQSPSSDSASNPLLLPNENLETPPPVANLPTESSAAHDVTSDVVNGSVSTDVATADQSAQQLTDVELAKKKAKQKPKKKTEEATQPSTAETRPPVESQPQQSIVVLQKEPAVVAPEVKKDTAREVAKETIKPSEQQKSPWSIFADSIKQGGETPCTPAQIAMHQCS
jgi:hypothetical protein